MKGLPEELEKTLHRVLNNTSLTHLEIAKRTGVDRSTISKYKWSDVDIRLSQIVKILDVLGYDVVIRKRK